MGNLTGIIIIGVIAFIVIFLLLREINCWYWKINERISLMNEQNDLLKKFISGSKHPDKVDTAILIEKHVDNQSKENEDNGESIKIKQDKLSGIPNEILDKLSSAKKYKVERLIDEMEKSDVIVYHDNSVKIYSKERWEAIVSSGESDKYELIYKFQQQN